jgi:UDP-glucuronate 4-epimerase
MEIEFNNVLVTGAAGFIGYHLSKRLLGNGCRVTGIDNLNSYYDVALKTARLEKLKAFKKFSFLKEDISNKEGVEKVFENTRFDVVVNLAAQAGVRYSLKNPHAYIDANIVGFINLLECCKKNQIKHLVFASSSSVYGANTKMPF